MIEGTYHYCIFIYLSIRLKVPTHVSGGSGGELLQEQISQLTAAINPRQCHRYSVWGPLVLQGVV